MKPWHIALAALALFAAGVQAASTFKPYQLKWWAIQPVTKPAVPAPKAISHLHNPIDAFVQARLEQSGLTMAHEADKRTLLRRVTFDVTGLPPTPEEMQAFLADDSARAYDKVVDRLLASPRYGERWARHWLDVARYADSEGFKADETRPNIWRYRDYVIQSLNEDKPYDRFVKEQIAGDELYPHDPNAVIATGFNRHFPDESNAANVMLRRQELLNDITDTVSVAFLGVTVGCARCHDHKFDPILQKDYYRLQSFFANTRIDDERVLNSPEKQTEWKQQNAVYIEKTASIRAAMETLLKPARDAFYTERFLRFPEEVQTVIRMPEGQRTPYQQQIFLKAITQLTFPDEEIAGKLSKAGKTSYQEFKTQLAAFDAIKPPPQMIAQVMTDASAAAPPTHILRGGAWDAPLDAVEPGFLSVIDPGAAVVKSPEDMPSTGRRTALANWIASPANPLTARVEVNRIWQHHFGRGIVGTPGDFGLMGERPSNPELLNWLATTFVEEGWSRKKLHRLILLSSTYRQTSMPDEQTVAKATAVDPDNKLLWRYNRRRLEGEAVRDSALAVAGLLNLKQGGPGVFPPRPMDKSSYQSWKADEDPLEADRRSIYVFVRRNARYPLFEAFDMPDTHESCSRRQQSVSVTQTLNLLNDPMLLDWAKAFAARVGNDQPMTTDARIQRSFRLAFLRAPTTPELIAARKFLAGETLNASADEGFVDLCQMLFNANEFLYID
jgi:hypothetical protein